ncbi:MAG: hypothetical protein IGR93_07760 [Hydrococcus sp. C42_A2020_068]|uniref:hypothetical protein n=1 Tax=Pleurocapsa sp. PCC 7327 TaxID=118163 RepID=UPI00029FBF53|nr:hypothetical protein [Pleurocapsa sp. PCC 7327]AFY78188.1 hypothetical protein Ple7327_2948 [Pleurocapsa sp. PCC 7327]MBF2019986.1 hypothetical protein [Hydrococcus sp. C42_A2020_068]
MKIEDLSFCEDLSFWTEVTDEDVSNVNSGYIDYWNIADPTASLFRSTGDFLKSVGLDGSWMYGAALNYYRW